MPARVIWRAARGERALTLTPADIAELDPNGTGAIVLFGMTYRAPVVLA
jgi:hypothetical protein